MKVLLTLGLDGDPEDFSKAVQAELSDLVARGGAQRGALDLRAAGDELDAVRELDTEHDASAMVSLWGVEAPATALAFALPDGSRLVGAYEVDEVVQREYERTWPAGAASPGVKIVCFVRRRPDLSQAAYREHWRERHGPARAGAPAGLLALRAEPRRQAASPMTRPTSTASASCTSGAPTRWRTACSTPKRACA